MNTWFLTIEEKITCASNITVIWYALTWISSAPNEISWALLFMSGFFLCEVLYDWISLANQLHKNGFEIKPF